MIAYATIVPGDVGRAVVYRAGHPGAKPEQGTIVRYARGLVFVDYGRGTPAATNPRDLSWLVMP
jgi:hypothetical protein